MVAFYWHEIERTSFAKRMCSRYPCLCLHAKSAHTHHIEIYATSFIHLTNVRGHHIPSALPWNVNEFPTFLHKNWHKIYGKSVNPKLNSEHCRNEQTAHSVFQTTLFLINRPFILHSASQNTEPNCSVCCFLRKFSEFAIQTNSAQIMKRIQWEWVLNWLAVFVELFYFL